MNIFLYIPLFYSCFLNPPKSSKINKIKNPSFDFKKIEKETLTQNNKTLIFCNFYIKVLTLKS
ncbi:hypothetical protein CV661_05005 [Borreliella burgdorferi]|nr:hypothetical protein CV674_06415 [Borreliella burgdorferi]PRR38168.1 hypothetical protein CV676_05020 [Borreliella burgdorferi]PRR53350.1 hypothetical protein CV661_05005 [Borreliella burgdorferi]